MMTRYRILLGLLLLAAPLSAQNTDPIRLIAHRGGIVDERYAENSPAAVEAAIRQGYWMIEVDVRESRDGKLVVQHDPDFERFYGVKRKVAEMSWTEISGLRAKPGNTRPMEFHELAALCRNRLKLMIDTKPPGHPEAFYAAMEKALRDNDLLDSAFFIGTPESQARFRGKAVIGVNRDQLRKLMTAGETTAGRYFLFEHGTTLDEEGLRLAAQAGVPPVVSINIFHYGNGDHWKGAKADIDRLKALGMTYFQIDSVYDRWLQPAQGSK